MVRRKVVAGQIALWVVRIFFAVFLAFPFY